MTREEQIKKVAEFQYDYIGSTDEKKAFKQGVLTGAEWADKNPDGSIIKWEKGLPTDGGRYIVTMQGVGVSTEAFIPGDVHDEHFFKEYVTAWCKLSDIKPYKEEPK